MLSTHGIFNISRYSFARGTAGAGWKESPTPTGRGSLSGASRSESIPKRGASEAMSGLALLAQCHEVQEAALWPLFHPRDLRRSGGTQGSPGARVIAMRKA